MIDPITWLDVLELVEQGRLPLIAVSGSDVACLWWQPAPEDEHVLYPDDGESRARLAVLAMQHARDRHGMPV